MLAPALVALATVVAFLPVLENGFVTWDDGILLLDNPHYRGFGWTGLRWMWTTTLLGHYMPLTWMSYALDHALFGLDPFGYHLQSLLLHVLAALAVYGLTLDLGRAALGRAGLVGAAALAALAFALHPLRVEPVAWASARSTVLGGLLALGSAWSYARGCARAGTGPMPAGWLAGSVATYALSLLAKESAVTLPAALLVLDVYPFRRLGGGPGRWLGPGVRRIWLEKLPFAAVALVLVPLGVLARLGAPGEAPPYDALLAGAVALHASAFYLWQSLGLGALSPVYELGVAARPTDWRFVLGAGAVIALTLVLAAGRRRWPGALAAWLAYLVLLVPVSGLVPLGRLHLAADRYSYLPLVGWAIAAGTGALVAWRHAGSRVVRGVSVALVGIVLVGWGAWTWRQAPYWHDGRTLWAYAVEATPESAVAQANLAAVLEREGRLVEAQARYEEAARLWPTYAAFWVSRGRVLAGQDRLEEALAALRRAVALAPRDAATRVALGVVLFRQGKPDAAVEQYEAALRLEPRLVLAHYNLALAYERLGRAPAAAAHYRRALEIQPSFREAAEGLGRVGGA